MVALDGVTDCPQWWTWLGKQHGDLAFDVGANGGGVVERLLGGFVKVVAFEPCRESFVVLEDRFVGDARVLMVPQAASAGVGQVELLETEHGLETGQLTSGHGLGHGEVTGARMVQSTTVDRYALLFGVPDFVKVDVEGHELQVLIGSAGVIAEACTTWAIEVHSREFLDPIDALFSRHGYSIGVWRHSAYESRTDPWWDHFYVSAQPR